jgi:hypothetical protein
MLGARAEFQFLAMRAKKVGSVKQIDRPKPVASNQPKFSKIPLTNLRRLLQAHPRRALHLPPAVWI